MSFVLVGSLTKKDLLEDFAEEEKERFMYLVAEKVKESIATKGIQEVEQSVVRTEQGLKEILLKAETLHCSIMHVPPDTFGEKGAEIRTVVKAGKKGVKAAKEALQSLSSLEASIA